MPTSFTGHRCCLFLDLSHLVRGFHLRVDQMPWTVIFRVFAQFFVNCIASYICSLALWALNELHLLLAATRVLDIQ
jgi:hypothetical protein